eukprot:Gb_39978 [translate_table: standard]
MDFGSQMIFIFIFILVISPNAFHSFAFASSSHKTNKTNEPNCSRVCVVQECNSLGIRYGKYCGVGWTGCPGEKPCDDLDECCKVHDQCVGNKGLMNIKCHEKFKKCIKKVLKSGKVGFSEQCPYEVAVPTMTQGMDMAIMFSQFSSPGYEL